MNDYATVATGHKNCAWCGERFVPYRRIDKACGQFCSGCHGVAMNNRKEYKQLHRSYPSVPGFKINKFVSLKMELIGRGFSEDEPLTTFRRLGLDDQLVNMERELAREGRQ